VPLDKGFKALVVKKGRFHGGSLELAPIVIKIYGGML
jgi:hypothetical protein